VGKTFAIKCFGQSRYKYVANFNFEKDKRLAAYFEGTLAPKELIKTLSIHADIPIIPEDTLIIFDEIQECPRALNSLKYFCEEANQYHVASAGSLLGVKVAKEEGFPVGKVNFLHLYPLTFFEFLTATNNDKLKRFLQEYRGFEPLPEPFHEKLLHLLKLYFYIGGMPEVVAEYVQRENLSLVREVQLEILNSYEKDFAKHAPSNEIMHITAVWKQVHRQLARENKKFVFSAIRQSARGRDYEVAIEWLVGAGLVHKSHLVETPKFPLSAYADAGAFKVFLSDVGLLAAQSHLSAHAVIEGDLLFTEFKGALTENFVAQELIAAGHAALFYWASSGIAEVDFLIETDHEIYPLEVKAGASSKKKSLLVYGDKYAPARLTRATTMNLKRDGKIDNWLLYLVSKLI
jgi:predicted AAA+ superfamily ATPase